MTLPPPDASLALLLLGDGRFPVGGHAHSAGVESAVNDGRVHDVASLEAYVAGRVVTTGLVCACAAVCAAAMPPNATSATTINRNILGISILPCPA